jgi:NADH dehydrogenase
MVEGGTNFLPGLSEKVSALLAEKMAQMSVQSRFASLITEVGKDFVMINMKERVDCDLLIWAGGVRSAKLPIDLDLEYDKKDRVVTNPSLNLKNCPNVFVAGDNLCFVDPRTKKTVLPTELEARKQGALVAKNIYRLIRRKPLRPYYPARVKFSVALPNRYAIYFTPNLMVAGFGGWLIRRVSQLRYFLSVLPVKKAFKLWL